MRHHLLLPAVLLPLAVSGAQAADLPKPAETPATWSVAVFGGPSWLNDIDTIYESGSTDTDVAIGYDPGYMVGAAIGFTFVDWARTEVEIAYAAYSVADLTIGSGDAERTAADVDGEISALSVMGNLWLGLDMRPHSAGAGAFGFSPYAGGGVGVGFVDSTGARAFDITDSTTALSWQVGAGIRFAAVGPVGFDIGYRFRGLTDVGLGEITAGDLTSNNVIVGVTLAF
jgi:opacity protein-like surface antigen